MADDDNEYLIGLGSNLGDRLAMLQRAVDMAAATVGTVTKVASLYATEPVGAATLPFLNSALVLTSAMPPEATMTALLGIEAALGRVRREKWGDRTIDLDLLLWRQVGDAPHESCRIWQSTALTLPHPLLLDRDFALVPAAEIAGTWRHPASNAMLSAECAQRGYSLTPMVGAELRSWAATRPMDL